MRELQFLMIKKSNITAEKKLSEINELNLSLERLVNDIVRLNEQKKINETALLNLHEQYKKINELQDLLTHISDKLFNGEKKLGKHSKIGY